MKFFVCLGGGEFENNFACSEMFEMLQLGLGRCLKMTLFIQHFSMIQNNQDANML
jgi:hypothetical protein